ncbi:efflux RND transporter periplasmic adaptor subunit [Alkalicoccobacillus plakortidis]|uniref:Efflux RND transporter periplasmic adaptor subunit n=1 Tax=Alkalicoccobacillus plakortidis TaxID=444060 RepID=A0ABT0XIP5_9BACI|nr:efflux RND transporter periplasmic adaptor subunit [Alkalicoccobacillus plakortidis]MCM2675223.1 efflux RND transporter periplasmic adaptor subunit [Alkalicoccobacillus plakortidis]
MGKRAWIVSSIVLASVLVVSGTGYGVYHFTSKAAAGEFGDEIYPMQVADFSYGMEQYSLQAFTGKIEAEKQEKVFMNPELGKVKETFVQEGDEINEGDPLFEYEPAEVEDTSLEIEQTQMELDLSYLQINQTQKSIDKLNKAIKKAEKEEKEILQQELDQSNYDLKVINLETGQVKKRLDALKKSGETNANIVVSKTTGIVQSINTDIADGAQNEAANEPFIQIVTNGDYLIKSQINELLIGTLEEGTEVLITAKNGQEGEWVGTVTEIGKLPVSSENEEYYGYEESNPQTSKYPFTVVLPEHEGLEIGYHVNVEPMMAEVEDTSDQVMIGQDWTFEEDGVSYVWKISDEQTWMKQEVEVGEFNEEMYTVEILSGLISEDYITYPEPAPTEGQEATLFEEEVYYD